MNKATTPARCYKQVCARPPLHVVSPMQGVSIKACDQHLEAAKSLARTGR